MCLYIINLSYIRREEEPVFVLSACGENWYFFWRIYNRYRIVGRRKKNSLARKDKAVLRNRFWVPNKACSVSIIAASSSFIVHILLAQLLTLLSALYLYYSTWCMACQVKFNENIILILDFLKNYMSLFYFCNL